MANSLAGKTRVENILFNERYAILLWFGLVAVAVILSQFHHSGINNFHIFRHVYIHTIAEQNLYDTYPQQYGDVNLYGPVFSLLIAPFAILPVWLGSALWVFFNAGILYYAIRQLPVQPKYTFAIILLCSNEMMNNASWFQVNPLIAACLILGFSFIQKGKDAPALFFIMLATFIKIYGIAGFAFFFFSKNKLRFIFWSIAWSAIFFLLPLLITSWQFLLQSYQDWFMALTKKAAKNVDLSSGNLAQDISLMGMIRRIGKIPALPDMVVLIPCFILFFSQYIHTNYFKDIRYRLYILCSVLLSVVIFSSGSEAVTYIIAVPALCLWYFLQPPSKAANIFFIAALVFTTFSYSDVFTPWFRVYIARPYALKALPSVMLWFIICWQVFKKQFLKINLNHVYFAHVDETSK
jgi:hypothetical protein